MSPAPGPRREAHPLPRRGPGAGDPSDNTAPGHPEDPLGDPESVARTACLKLLQQAPRTRSQLATKLSDRGVPAEVAQRVLDRFTEVGLIDDASFARAWVDSRQRTRGLASRALAGELRRRGVDRETVEQALAQVNPDREEDTARDLVRRKLRATARLDDKARARRLLGLLARKGYSADLAGRVVRSELADDESALAEE